ncbi:cytosine/purine/uracil/thiamine/allantoin permease family protein [Klebsiella pneumoniae]|nr:cytosine/purine/uracil/thiamine/allantoin permease family protein [Klebsiella pneumoniae]
MSNSNDFPLVEAPAAGRKGVFSIAMVLFSFTFFTGTMFAGGKLGVSFSIVNLLWIAVIGNALLALYAASLGWIAARSGLNTVLMAASASGRLAASWPILFLALPSWAGTPGAPPRSLSRW